MRLGDGCLFHVQVCMCSTHVWIAIGIMVSDGQYCHGSELSTYKLAALSINSAHFVHTSVPLLTAPVCDPLVRSTRCIVFTDLRHMAALLKAV